MTYKFKKKHRLSHQVKVLLNEDQFDRLLVLAGNTGIQHSVLSRIIIKAVIEIVEQTGELPDWLEAERARLQRQSEIG